MNRFAKLLSGILSVLTIGLANAQQDAQFSQYMFNNLYTNPGFAGLEGCPKFTAIHRTQWVNYDGGGAPQGQVLTASLPVRILMGGLGFQLSNDQTGPFRNVDLLLSYSYHIAIGSGKLGLGIRSGIFNRSLNTKYIYTDAKDPRIEDIDNKSLNQLSPDFALGAFYYHPKFYVGVSLNHVIKEQLQTVNAELSRHMTVTGGYNFQAASNIVLTPSFITKYDATGEKWSTDGSLMATFNNKYWGGLSFRQSDALIPFVGISFLKNNAMKVGFAYDYTLINQTGKATSSYEIMLSYSLPPFVPPVKPVIRTPRYRF
jgi:type IX secretion system PorP/SprF family membrane protein